MAVHSNSEESRILRQLIPLATFPNHVFKDLCDNITVEQVQDAVIFKRGDTNTDLVYLLNGSVTLQAEGLVVEVISSESESAKFALAHQIPRKIDAVANGLARIVRLDAQTVNNPPPAIFQEDSGYTVIDETVEDSDDWMTTVLRLPLFQSLPPANLQKILSSLQTSQHAPGEVIVSTGSAVDYFYIIQKGQCRLSRKGIDGMDELDLGAGGSFGEEYLLTGFQAQETVTALTEVSLIQLEKNQFLSKVAKPSIHFISREAMTIAIGNGSVLLDVRLPEQFENQSLEDSANIPLLALRMRMAEIPKDKQIIVACENGKKSEAAAFLLVKNKCNAVVLQDGMGIEEEAVEAREVIEPTVALAEPNQADSGDDKPGSGHSRDVVNDQLTVLTTENARLTQHIRELEERNKVLLSEKQQAEEQCKTLTLQQKKLKEILARLTKRK